jgi:hypothetical protein
MASTMERLVELLPSLVREAGLPWQLAKEVSAFHIRFLRQTICLTPRCRRRVEDGAGRLRCRKLNMRWHRGEPITPMAETGAGSAR